MNISKKTENIKFLCIRLSSIGDIILTTPIIRSLRTKFPHAQIDFLVSKPFVSLLQGNPAISNIIPYDKTLPLKNILKYKDEIKNKFGTYDFIIDLQNNNRSKIFRCGLGHRILSIPKRRLYKWCLVALKKRVSAPRHVVDNYFIPVKKLGAAADNQGTEVNISASFRLPEKSSPSIKTIAIAPGATHFTKRLPAEILAEAMRLINSKGEFRFVVAGGRDDVATAEILEKLFGGKNFMSFAGKLALDETAALLSQADLLITNDTGLMHIGSAVKTPILAIFGSTVPDLGFTPYHCKYKIIELTLPCRPCTHIGRSECPRGDFACMKNIRPEIIASTALELLDISR